MFAEKAEQQFTLLKRSNGKNERFSYILGKKCSKDESKNRNASFEVSFKRRTTSACKSGLKKWLKSCFRKWQGATRVLVMLPVHDQMAKRAFGPWVPHCKLGTLSKQTPSRQKMKKMNRKTETRKLWRQSAGGMDAMYKCVCSWAK